MATFPTVFPFLISALVAFIGIKTIITRKTTVFIQLWGSDEADTPGRYGGVYAKSHQTGSAAVLVGVIEVALAIGILMHFY